MWDFYKVYFCVFIEMSLYLYFDEDNSYVSKLVDWIVILEEICYIFFVIFVDGK